MAQMNVNHQIAWKKQKQICDCQQNRLYLLQLILMEVMLLVYGERLLYGNWLWQDNEGWFFAPHSFITHTSENKQPGPRGALWESSEGLERGMWACQIIFPSNERRFQQSSRPSGRGKSLLVHWHNGAIEGGSDKDFAINQITIIKPHCYKQTWQRLNSVKSDAKQLPHACWSSTNFPSCLFPKDSMTPWTLAVEKRQH